MEGETLIFKGRIFIAIVVKVAVSTAGQTAGKSKPTNSLFFILGKKQRRLTSNIHSKEIMSIHRLLPRAGPENRAERSEPVRPPADFP
jgi:hypothetical protein